MSFVTEFRKNIPYIADMIAANLCNRNIVETDDVFTYNVLEDNIEEFLGDWLNEYQTEEAQSKEEQ